MVNSDFRVSQAEYARFCCVTRAAVAKAGKVSGNVILESDGTINPYHPQNMGYRMNALARKINEQYSTNIIADGWALYRVVHPKTGQGIPVAWFPPYVLPDEEDAFIKDANYEYFTLFPEKNIAIDKNNVVYELQITHCQNPPPPWLGKYIDKENEENDD